MVFKEMVAYLLDGKGGYTCSNDIKEELFLYKGFTDNLQKAVDRAREINPEWTEERLHEYVTSGSTGSMLPKIKECLESHGYDTSTLPHVVVPEFGDVASLILKIGIGGAVIAGAYAANYLRNKGLSYKI